MHTTLNMLLRLPRHGETIETIARLHKDVIDRYQTVWLGILGRKYSAANIESIRKEGEYLYIVQMQVEGRPTLFKGRIADIRNSLPKDQHHLAPAYYNSLGVIGRAQLWVRLSSLESTPRAELDKLRVRSSGKEATTILKGMAYLAIVEIERR